MDYSSSTNINTSTLYHLVGKTIDTVTNYSPLLLKILGNQKQWKGYQMKFPIQYQATDTGTWFTGLEKFSTTKVNDFVNMVFNPTGREEAVTLSGIEMDLNKSDQVIDLAARETEKTANKLADVIATSFYTLQTGNAFLSVLDAADDKLNLSSLKSPNSVKTLTDNAEGNTEPKQYARCNDYEQTSIKRNNSWNGIGRWLNQSFQFYFGTFKNIFNFA